MLLHMWPLVKVTSVLIFPTRVCPGQNSPRQPRTEDHDNRIEQMMAHFTKVYILPVAYIQSSTLAAGRLETYHAIILSSSRSPSDSSRFLLP